MLGLVTTLNDKAPVELRELAEPQPQRNEALVAVHAISLNRGELRSVRNNGEGWVPGQDVGGVVLKQAEDGSGPPAGARVVALTDEFGWAQRVAVPGHRMAVLPDNVSFAQAATLPVAGLTALRTLRHGAPLLGKRVLITGAAGGVGTIAVQLAARSGARVTAVVGRAERAAGMKEFGALEVIEGIDKAQGRFGLILELAGGASLAHADQACRGEGHCRGVRQFVRRTDDARIRRLPRRAEFACAELQLFLFRIRGSLRAGPRITGVAGRRWITEAADRRGAKLARLRRGGRAVARSARCRQGCAVG